jgi:hypothetical protein
MRRARGDGLEEFGKPELLHAEDGTGSVHRDQHSIHRAPECFGRQGLQESLCFVGGPPFVKVPAQIVADAPEGESHETVRLHRRARAVAQVFRRFVLRALRLGHRRGVYSHGM